MSARSNVVRPWKANVALLILAEAPLGGDMAGK